LIWLTDLAGHVVSGWPTIRPECGDSQTVASISGTLRIAADVNRTYHEPHASGVYLVPARLLANRLLPWVVSRIHVVYIVWSYAVELKNGFTLDAIIVS